MAQLVSLSIDHRADALDEYRRLAHAVDARLASMSAAGVMGLGQELRLMVSIAPAHGNFYAALLEEARAAYAAKMGARAA